MPVAPANSIAALQKSVGLHLTAVEHYATVAEHLDRIGYGKLGSRFRDDAEEERGHLKACIERLEFYNVAPALEHAAPAWPRLDVAGILTASLAFETAAAEVERQNILDARAAGDEVTALVFVELLKGSEESIKHIEADKLVISQVGLDNWLSNQAT